MADIAAGKVWARREDRLNQVSAFGIAFVLGWVACSAYEKVPVLWQQKNQLEYAQHVVIPKLKTQVKVEHAKASAATAKLIQAKEQGGRPQYSDPPTDP